VSEIREVRQQFRGLKNRLGEDGRYQTILASGDSLEQKMTPIEEQLLQVKIKSSEASLNFPVLTDERLHSVFFSVDAADAPPTAQQYAVVEELTKTTTPLVAQWKQMLGSDVAALNQMMLKENVPAIYVPAGRESTSAGAGTGQR